VEYVYVHLESNSLVITLLAYGHEVRGWNFAGTREFFLLQNARNGCGTHLAPVDWYRGLFPGRNQAGA